jgi:hypothetical protein
MNGKKRRTMSDPADVENDSRMAGLRDQIMATR